MVGQCSRSPISIPFLSRSLCGCLSLCLFICFYLGSVFCLTYYRLHNAICTCCLFPLCLLAVPATAETSNKKLKERGGGIAEIRRKLQQEFGNIPASPSPKSAQPAHLAQLGSPAWIGPLAVAPYDFMQRHFPSQLTKDSDNRFPLPDSIQEALQNNTAHRFKSLYNYYKMALHALNTIQ